MAAVSSGSGPDSSGDDPGAALLARFERVVRADAANAHQADVAGWLADVASLTRCLQGREVDFNQRLHQLSAMEPGVDPGAINAAATGRSARAATHATERARAAQETPELKAQVSQGRLSGEHLDAFAAAVTSLEPHLRPSLLALEAELSQRAAATQATVEQFRQWLQHEVRALEADDGKRRLERQRRNTRLRIWANPHTGMVHLAGEFDPETGAVLHHRLASQLETRFHGERPPECPTDPLGAHHWLQAHALIDLVRGAASGAGRPEMIVVIDQRTFEHGRHAESQVDCGPGIELPIATIRAIGQRSTFVPVVVNRDGVVIRQGTPVATYEQIVASLERPVSLVHGRGRRHASAQQRRALRAMYRTCAIPGCGRHISTVEAHHIRFWEHGGHTDLHNLLPLCRHHHDRLHAEKWRVHLGTDRSLTVRARDGTTLCRAGPPRATWDVP
ncbi:MAG: HNH endonuclease [Actinomycetota bacterium]